jgi:hypothetical protein
MNDPGEPVQDGLLMHFLAMATAADANVEKRIDREVFDYRRFMQLPKPERTSFHDTVFKKGLK